MRGFLAGDLAPGEVFDLELMARFLAVVEVWEAHHCLAWHNMRFYYNPLTARLEPVVFDGHLQARPLGPGLTAGIGHFTPWLLEDDEFRAVFVRVLARIAGEMADGSVAEWALEMERDLLPALQEGLEHVPHLGIERRMKRARDIARIDDALFPHFMPPLGSPDMQYPEPVRFYRCGDCSKPRLELVNAMTVPVSVLSMAATGDADAVEEATRALAGVSFPIELPATTFMEAPTPQHRTLDFREDPNHPIEFEAVVRVHGQAQRHTVPVLRYPEPLSASPIPVASLDQALARHPFLSFDADEGMLRAAKGEWDIQGSLILPDGVGLALGPGTELRFGKGEALIASGPLVFEGSPEQPVVLRPRDGHETWGGVASLRTEAPHRWSHVRVESTSGINKVGWRLTGGVTLRAAEVEISDSLFRGHRGEDALNLVRSQFLLDRVEFKDAPSDALDADFSDGEIRGGRYSEIGGDGIDVSGANVVVSDVELVDIADKAISVGEASRVQARNLRIERVGTGAASKDRSELLFEDSLVVDAVTAGVSVYTKKPEYGPASAVVNRVEMRSVGTPALVQTGSRATLDGESVAEVPLETETLY